MNESSMQNKGATARPNIVLFIFAVWFIFVPSISQIILGDTLHHMIIHALGVAEKCVILVLLYLLIAKQRPKNVLSIAPLGFRNGLYVTVIALASIPFALLIIWGRALLTDTIPTEIPPFYTIWLGILMAGLVIATTEELLFRGAIYHEYREQGVSIWKIALITGVFFGLVHVEIVQVSYAAVLGIGMTFMLYYTRSIWAPILYHVLVNSLAHLLDPTYFVDSYTDLRDILPTYLIVMGVAALALLPFGVVCWRKMVSDNTRHEKKPTKESKAFVISYWALIIVMIVLILIMNFAGLE